jgi:hypothetical protein
MTDSTSSIDAPVVDDPSRRRPDHGRPDPDAPLVVDGPDEPSTGADRAIDGAPDRDVSATASAPWWTRWRPAAAWLLSLCALGPIVVAGIESVTKTWYPAGDWALLELRTMDVGTRHTPLVGVYSRFSWNHPGPFLFWLFAVPYRLAGGRPSSLVLAAALVNALAVAGMLALAWRRGRLGLLAPVAVVLTLLGQTIGPSLLRDPWNAWVTVIPFGLLLLATWAAIEGDRWGLPLVAVVGAFLAQSHIGFVPFVAVATVAAAVGSWVRCRDRRRLVIAGAVLAVCWLPVVVDLALGGSNISKIIGHFGSDGAAAGWSRAVGVTAVELGSPFAWLGAPEPINADGGGVSSVSASALVLPLLVYAVAALAAWRARARDALRLQAVLGGAALIGMWAVSRITNNVFDYLVRWWWLIAALGAASAAWSLWRLAAPALRRALRPRPDGAEPSRWWQVATAVLAAVALLISARAAVHTASDVPSARMPVDDWFGAMDVAEHTAIPRIPTGAPVMIAADGPLAGWVSDALAPRLEAAGIPVRVDDSGINSYKFGDQRVAPVDGSLREVVMVTGTRVDDYRRAGVGTELATYDPLTPTERTTYDRLQDELRVEYHAAGRDDLVQAIADGASLHSDTPVPGLDQRSADAYDALRAKGVDVAVFLVDRDDSPPPPPEPLPTALAKPASWWPTVPVPTDR